VLVRSVPKSLPRKLVVGTVDVRRIDGVDVHVRCYGDEFGVGRAMSPVSASSRLYVLARQCYVAHELIYTWKYTSLSNVSDSRTEA